MKLKTLLFCCAMSLSASPVRVAAADVTPTQHILLDGRNGGPRFDGIGVVEGNGGFLLTGQPWQSVHDGERLMHEPLRLSILIEAPREAIAGILERHANVRALFDNRWLYLFAMDGEGRMAWRYTGGGRWE